MSNVATITAALPALCLTLSQPDARSMKGLLGFASLLETSAFLDQLSDNALCALPFLFECWAIEGHQLPPLGNWMTWVIMGGRGAGKTRAGAEWVRAMVEGATPSDPGRCRRVALVAETLDQAREIMVMGESGILACSPPDRRPKWNGDRRQLLWPNGATAQTFSASDPESLRGPQFDAAWCDELAKWKKGQDAWDMLQFALRMGLTPQQVVTTTPKNIELVREILKDKLTVVTRASTWANRANLSEQFFNKMMVKYDGSTTGRQELDGELLEEVEGAMWNDAALEEGRIHVVGAFSRIVVAVDPPVTGGKNSDDCGIVVVGVNNEGPPKDWRAVVLEDCSISGASPQVWAEKAVNAYHRHKAERLVAEVNQGGDLVASLVRGIDPMISFRAVRATRGKAVRAEPVAALYEQGRIVHLGRLKQLESQMCAMTRNGFMGKGSPDRVDALVWAITEVMIEPAAGFMQPRVRSL